MGKSIWTCLQAGYSESGWVGGEVREVCDVLIEIVFLFPQVTN
jgi:hypothetical protein